MNWMQEIAVEQLHFIFFLHGWKCRCGRITNSINYLNFSIENFVKVCLQVLAPLAKIHFWSFRLDILTHDALLSRKGGLPKTSRPPPLLLSSKLPHCPAPGGKNEENEKWWNYEKINAHLKKSFTNFCL